MSAREEFEQIFTDNINRQGSKELLEWLKTTDFFTAPASTRFHCACEGGLVQHSVSVYRVMREKHFEKGDSEESFAVCGLLHDVCKAQYYKVSTRNFKNPETGAWEQRPYFSVEDSFPYGHGEKSVFQNVSIRFPYRKDPLAYGRVRRYGEGREFRDRPGLSAVSPCGQAPSGRPGIDLSAGKRNIRRPPAGKSERKSKLTMILAARADDLSYKPVYIS